jgi:hypothetical protein
MRPVRSVGVAPRNDDFDFPALGRKIDEIEDSKALLDSDNTAALLFRLELVSHMGALGRCPQFK